MTRSKKIMICGDLCNLGDLALVFQNLEISTAEENIIRYWVPLPEMVCDQVAARGGQLVSGKSPAKFLSAIMRSDVVIGGGQLVRQNTTVASLTSLYVGLVVCRMFGGKVTTRGLGVSKITRPLYRFLWRRILSNVDHVRVRDERSRANVRDLMPSLDAELTTDMAFLHTDLHKQLRYTTEPTTVLIAPCIDLGEGRTIDTPAFGATLGAIADALPGRALSFVCHDPRDSMDARAADYLIAKYALNHARRHVSYDLQALFEQYNKAEIIVTNRLHSLIFGLLAGKPVVVIADGAQKTRDMADRFHVPVVVDQDKTTVHNAIAAALNFDRGQRTQRLSEQAFTAQRNLGDTSHTA